MTQKRRIQSSDHPGRKIQAMERKGVSFSVERLLGNETSEERHKRKRQEGGFPPWNTSTSSPFSSSSLKSATARLESRYVASGDESPLTSSLCYDSMFTSPYGLRHDFLFASVVPSIFPIPGVSIACEKAIAPEQVMFDGPVSLSDRCLPHPTAFTRYLGAAGIGVKSSAPALVLRPEDRGNDLGSVRTSMVYAPPPTTTTSYGKHRRFGRSAEVLRRPGVPLSPPGAAIPPFQVSNDLQRIEKMVRGLECHHLTESVVVRRNCPGSTRTPATDYVF